jgi:hypothetical protein
LISDVQKLTWLSLNLLFRMGSSNPLFSNRGIQEYLSARGAVGFGWSAEKSRVIIYGPDSAELKRAAAFCFFGLMQEYQSLIHPQLLKLPVEFKPSKDMIQIESGGILISRGYDEAIDILFSSAIELVTRTKGFSVELE